jgi:protein TonB
MAPRCFLFSPDGGTSDVIRQVLAELGVVGESCSDTAAASEKIAKESFQLVVIDWDQQPEATALLTTARERKASERPLILAIVSDDASVPKALQAGANSILRRPILVNQAKDTLTTARDLLRARVESSSAAQAAAAAAASSASSTSNLSENTPGTDHTVRTGEFLNTDSVSASGQFETEAAAPTSQEAPVAEPMLRDLEPVTSQMPTPLPPPAQEEPRTLEELLRSRGVGRPTGPPEPPAGSAGGKPEMLGFDQTPSFSHSSGAGAAPARAKEQRKEPALFSSYLEEPGEPKQSSPSRFRLGKGMIVFSAILAGCAVGLAPQAPWHPGVQALWARGQRSVHAWLNPQPVTTPVAPTAHEDFGRAGDEYKLPVVETIPDATTDPSQIHVVPVIDPTAKKPNNSSASPDQPAVIDAPNTTPTDGQPSTTSAPDGPPPQPTVIAPQPAPTPAQPATNPAPAGTTSPAPVTTAPSAQPPAASAVTYTPVSPAPVPPRRQPAPYVPPPAPKVPSSLKSQISTMVPDASGNKPPEAAMQSIEPVAVPELTERTLITDQPPLDFPAAAGGQHGTVLLQVLIGRDGTVQDAKFLQGSLAFARAAIAGVRQWKFKPYIMNGRPVSIQTTLTIKFPPQ